MKELFGKPRRRKDGSEGKVLEVPDVRTLQRDPHTFGAWVGYSAYDAEGTWLLRENLEAKLRQMDWQADLPLQNKTMWDYYLQYMMPFAAVPLLVPPRPQTFA